MSAGTGQSEGERGPALHETIAPAKERNARCFNRPYGMAVNEGVLGTS